MLNSLSAEVDANISSTIRYDLLCDDNVVTDIDNIDDDDDTIVTQLLSTNNERLRRLPQTSWFIHRQGRCLTISFALLSWLGLFASGWSNFSCNLVAVQYPEGGVRLTIDAIGYWSYQKEVTNNDTKTTFVCVDYDATLTQQPRNILPSSKTLQIYAILASSSYFVAFVAGIVSVVMLSIHSENTDEIQYPTRGVTMTMILASFFFACAAIFHIIPLYALIHYNDGSTNDQSPICNPSYSTCYLGPSGYLAIFAISAAFVCGLVLCLTVYHVRYKSCCSR
jgi:hypothetical protein